VARNGYPADVIVVNDTPFGRQFIKRDAPLVQPYLNCCAENIWFPLLNAINEIGATEIVRGQRKSDVRQSFVRDGDVIEGKKYTFPIYEWTDEQVFSYLKEVGAEMPAGYARGEKTGRDCWDCTAYLDENAQRIKNLPDDKRTVVLSRLHAIREAVMGSDLVKDYGHG
jgi:3'-phosphoadenosine 5'-phosphosulfate sulfotransferase (PAPS reductase)/FAD synthetase